MGKEILSSGAEAVIYLEGDKIIKERVSKAYRHSELDGKIIKRRTKSETKILKKAGKFVCVPEVFGCETDKIFMEFIGGDKLSLKLNSYDLDLQKKVLFEIGESVAKLHGEGIIHGDLTTSNMIYVLDEAKIFFIDFGLGFLEGKYEDKGVDVHLLKQALEAKHFEDWEILFEEFRRGYFSVDSMEAEKVFNKLIAIEKRGRYKH